MRHGKKFNHLSRTASHRNAMLSNMAGSLILSKRITTTVAKAKALRKYVEPLLTKSKEDTTHNRRIVFSSLKNKEVLKELFDEVATKIANRPGGYTRIIKLGSRLGDDAEMALIELVDYNELLLGGEKKEKKTTRRSRRGGSSKSTSAKAEGTAETKEATPKKEAKKEDAPKAEAKKEEAPKAETKKAEAKTEDAPKAEKKETKSDDKSDEKKGDE
ncbi:large subunit ribosomal protein L17 [Marivirga sericea]|uniref:Large ribosomal subunit protein bL17 n=1 Tax=Marivirga sericea TaxID=1028 RepID=A0A1X7KX95_9BACT|nr:50S ribosomal protein L17 [Marivirga sericea]SMG45505.1 large subunit ribosomal protein L17 [Marivirga sericea]